MCNKYSINNRDIVVIGLQPWYTDIGSNCKNIAIEFAKENRVLYVNVPLNRSTLWKEKELAYIKHHKRVIHGEEDPLTKIAPNLWNYYPKRVHESINWVPSTRLFSLVNYHNNKRFAIDIKDAVDRLDFKDYIIFNDNDIFRGYWLKKLLTPSLYIYYCRDFLTSSGYFRRHGASLEPKHVAEADLSLSNSFYLTKYLKKYTSNAYFVGQGCDTSLFNADIQYDLPNDITKTDKPLIGYVGTLTARRLDISILLKIAQTRPGWQLVLVGPEDEVFAKSELHQFPNVTFVGQKDLSQLPAYMQAFDVCINPQLINELTIGNYPLKIDEYLAMGKPVVATNTDMMEMFRDYCYLANNPDEYIDLISAALLDDTVLKNDRIGFARQHSWQNSVGAICDHIRNALK